MSDEDLLSIARKKHGFLARGVPSRFSEGNWMWQGDAVLRCGLCGHVGTAVYRRHYERAGHVFHYWGILCDFCEGLSWNTMLDDDLRQAYFEWGEMHPFDCPTCDRPDDGIYLVLANSRKLGGSCVAMVDHSGTWRRPVSDVDGGELDRSQCWLPGESRVVQPLDVVDVSLGPSRATSYQPEDVELPAVWKLADPQSKPADIGSWLERAVDHGADFLRRGQPDRISQEDVRLRPLESSLALVKPGIVEWRVLRTMAGKKQVRVSFNLEGVTDSAGRRILYDLVVTDPVWEQKVRDQVPGTGKCHSRQLGISVDAAIYFTVSLGEPFKGDHYKLVAAVIIPSKQTR